MSKKYRIKDAFHEWDVDAQEFEEYFAGLMGEMPAMLVFRGSALSPERVIRRDVPPTDDDYWFC